MMSGPTTTSPPRIGEEYAYQIPQSDSTSYTDSSSSSYHCHHHLQNKNDIKQQQNQQHRRRRRRRRRNEQEQQQQLEDYSGDQEQEIVEEANQQAHTLPLSYDYLSSPITPPKESMQQQQSYQQHTSQPPPPPPPPPHSFFNPLSALTQLPQQQQQQQQYSISPSTTTTTTTTARLTSLRRPTTGVSVWMEARQRQKQKQRVKTQHHHEKYQHQHQKQQQQVGINKYKAIVSSPAGSQNIKNNIINMDFDDYENSDTNSSSSSSSFDNNNNIDNEALLPSEKDDDEDDDELEQTTRRIRTELFQTEVIELAKEAERAADAGHEKFVGKFCTYRDDDNDTIAADSNDNNNYRQHSRANSYDDIDTSIGSGRGGVLPPPTTPGRNHQQQQQQPYLSSLSPTKRLLPSPTTQQSLLYTKPSLNVTRATSSSSPFTTTASSRQQDSSLKKLHVLKLRDVADVIPKMEDLHLHLKIHMSSSGVNVNYSSDETDDDDGVVDDNHHQQQNIHDNDNNSKSSILPTNDEKSSSVASSAVGRPIEFLKKIFSNQDQQHLNNNDESNKNNKEDENDNDNDDGYGGLGVTQTLSSDMSTVESTASSEVGLVLSEQIVSARRARRTFKPLYIPPGLSLPDQTTSILQQQQQQEQKSQGKSRKPLIVRRSSSAPPVSPSMSNDHCHTTKSKKWRSKNSKLNVDSSIRDDGGTASTSSTSVTTSTTTTTQLSMEKNRNNINHLPPQHYNSNSNRQIEAMVDDVNNTFVSTNDTLKKKWVGGSVSLEQNSLVDNIMPKTPIIDHTIGNEEDQQEEFHQEFTNSIRRKDRFFDTPNKLRSMKKQMSCQENSSSSNGGGIIHGTIQEADVIDNFEATTSTISTLSKLSTLGKRENNNKKNNFPFGLSPVKHKQVVKRNEISIPTLSSRNEFPVSAAAATTTTTRTSLPSKLAPREKYSNSNNVSKYQHNRPGGGGSLHDVEFDMPSLSLSMDSSENDITINKIETRSSSSNMTVNGTSQSMTDNIENNAMYHSVSVIIGYPLQPKTRGGSKLSQDVGESKQKLDTITKNVKSATVLTTPPRIKRTTIPKDESKNVYEIPSNLVDCGVNFDTSQVESSSLDRPCSDCLPGLNMRETSLDGKEHEQRQEKVDEPLRRVSSYDSKHSICQGASFDSKQQSQSHRRVASVPSLQECYSNELFLPNTPTCEAIVLQTFSPAARRYHPPSPAKGQIQAIETFAFLNNYMYLRKPRQALSPNELPEYPQPACYDGSNPCADIPGCNTLFDVVENAINMLPRRKVKEKKLFVSSPTSVGGDGSGGGEESEWFDRAVENFDFALEALVGVNSQGRRHENQQKFYYAPTLGQVRRRYHSTSDIPNQALDATAAAAPLNNEEEESESKIALTDKQFLLLYGISRPHFLSLPKNEQIKIKQKRALLTGNHHATSI